MREGSVRWEQNRAFVLINKGQRRSSNLGFRTLHAEKQRNTFISKYCRYISAEFCQYDTSATSSYRPTYIGVPIHRSSSSIWYVENYSVQAHMAWGQKFRKSSKISDLLLFFSYFASQNKEITSDNLFFDVCCVN